MLVTASVRWIVYGTETAVKKNSNEAMSTQTGLGM